jgi:hypothetical protein
MPKTQLLCKDDMYANPWLIQLKLFETGAQNNFNKLLQNSELKQLDCEIETLSLKTP